MTVIKRNSSASSKDLIDALKQFCILLKGQGEDEAIAALEQAAASLGTAQPGTDLHKQAIKIISDAFGDEHELGAYILENADPNAWTDTEQLSLAATRVQSLAKRFR